MKRSSFDLLSGILIAIIILLALAAGWLVVSIADQELVRNKTPVPWVTATFLPENNTFLPSPQPAITPTVNPTVIEPLPTFTPLPAPPLPAGHPTAGPQPQDCVDCHSDPHGGGG